MLGMARQGNTLSTWAAHAPLILMAWQGTARRGTARQGKARQGNTLVSGRLSDILDIGVAWRG